MSNDSTSYDELMRLAKQHNGKREYEEAIGYCSQAIRLDSTCIVAYDYRGDAYRSLGHAAWVMKEHQEAVGYCSKAIVDYGKTIEIDPTNGSYDGLSWACEILFHLIGTTKAMRMHGKIIRSDPHFLWNIYRNGYENFKIFKQYKMAIQDFKNARKIDMHIMCSRSGE